MINQIHHSDWKALLESIESASVDLLLTDMPYGTTACSWDTVIDLAAWWPEVWRVCKPRAAVVCTASQPFTTTLISSALGEFRYEWIWDKVRPVGFLNAKHRPMMKHEVVLVFINGTSFYYPQMKPMSKPVARRSASSVSETNNHINLRAIDGDYVEKYPHSILTFSNGSNTERLHPTQKPVALFEYMIRTYTEPGALVVDPFVGSGTTAIAARNTGRDYICGDLSAEYVAIARERLDTTPYKPIDATGDDVSDLPLFKVRKL